MSTSIVNTLQCNLLTETYQEIRSVSWLLEGKKLKQLYGIISISRDISKRHNYIYNRHVHWNRTHLLATTGTVDSKLHKRNIKVRVTHKYWIIIMGTGVRNDISAPVGMINWAWPTSYPIADMHTKTHSSHGWVLNMSEQNSPRRTPLTD